jgi:hypothetical protein
MSLAGVGVVGRILTPPLPALTQGGYQMVRGKVAQKDDALVLELPRSMKIEGRAVQSIVLAGGVVKPGQQVTLYGRVDLRPADGVVVLSGVSNVGAGEPRFDVRNGRFVATVGHGAGTELPSLNLNSRDVRLGAPARTAVIDAGQKKVFFANLNGFLPPGANAFHGVDASVPLRSASRTDQLRWVVKAGQIVTKRNDQPLERLGNEGTSVWFQDPAQKTALRLTGKKIDAVFSLK